MNFPDGLTDIAGIDEIADGGMKKVDASGRSILLIRSSDRVYATDALCPHLQADLSEGTLQGTLLTCPLHGSVFNITNGFVLRWTDLPGSIRTRAVKARPPRPLRTYPAYVENGRIFVSF